VLSVNISARQFAQSDLVGIVGQILERTGINPSRLELAITESVVMDQSEASVERLRGLREEPMDLPIVKTVIALAHGLGIDVVAEGIETQSQYEQLRSLECDHGQGFWFARPLPHDEIERLFGAASGRLVALPG